MLKCTVTPTHLCALFSAWGCNKRNFTIDFITKIVYNVFVIKRGQPQNKIRRIRK